LSTSPLKNALQTPQTYRINISDQVLHSIGVAPAIPYGMAKLTMDTTAHWAAGSVTPGTAGTPTAVTLPTTKNTSVLSAVSAELSGAPTFTGTAGTVTVS